MKELQNIIHRHFEDPKQKKRYLAVLIALSMLVSFMVPLILMEPADSITKNKFRASSAAGIDIPNLNNGLDANNGYSKGSLSEVTLLIGYGVDWAADCQSAEQVIEAAKMKYFLGIASDFCVFLEGDFEPKDADAEGRVAVGGDVVFEHNQYNYQLGAGDFGDSIALIDTDNYKGVTNFAHLIMGGDILTNIATFGTKDRGASLADENKDRYKRFVVYNEFELSSNTHFGDGGAMSYGGDHGHYGAGFSESSQFYKRDNLIDFEKVFIWLKEQSIKLGRKSAKGSTKISYEPHERVGSANGTTNFEGGNLLTVTFTGPGRDSGLDTIYFDLDEWNVDTLTDGTPINEGDYIQSVRFEDVPENANLVVNCGGEIIRIGAAGDKDFFSTYINGEIISNTGDYNSNNNKKSEQILYNFYECGLKPEVIDTTIQTIKNEDGTIKETREVPYQLFLDCNFNGSVLAPNAIVVSDYHCGGHLSGALIAQSFNGGLEFGYRPYRGSTDILGSTAGYAIPFNKFKQDGSTYLPGAMFAITEAGADGKMIESWKTGTTTSYITIPSKVDFEGDTTYTGQNNTISGEYIVQEQNAPEGYVLSDKTYRLYVNETVDVGTLIKTDNGTIPTRILVNLEIKDDNGELIDSYEMTIRDTYSEDGLIQRIISIKNENGKQYFVLDINPEDGKIKSIGEPKDTSVLDSAEAEGALNNIVLYANQIVDYLSSEGTEGGETEGQDETTTTTAATTSADETTTTTVTSSLFPPGYQEPTLTVTYSVNQKLNSVIIPSQDNVGRWEWVNGSQDVGDVGERSFSARFYPTVSGYTEKEVSLKVIVEQATPIPPQSYTVPYGTYLSAIQLPSDNNGRWEWIDSDQTGTTTESPYSYEVIYVPENDNYKAISSSVSVTFTKIDPPQGSYTIPYGLTVDYGKTLADVNLSEFSDDNGTWTWQLDLSTSVGPAGTSNFVAVYTPNNGNYNSITQSIPITVNKIDPTYTIPENLTAVYGQTLQNITLPSVDNGHWVWENSGNSVGNVGLNTHNLKFVPNDQGNYNTKTVQVVVDVAKADPSYTVPTGLNVKYGSALNTVNLPDGWSWHEDANPTKVITDNAGTELTNLKAVFTPSDTANYNIITKELTVVVAKADPVVNPVYENKVYTQFDSIPLIQLADGSTSGTIKWCENTPSQLKYGKNVFTWEFTPVDATNYNTLKGTIEIVANPIPTTEINIDESVADDFAHNDVNYYYDPDSVMIMPVPEQTPSFNNEYGLVFKKLDENGNLLPGATIQLQSGIISEGKFELDEEAVYNAESELKWDWGNGTSSTATIAVKEITLSQLNEGVVYRFYEIEPPSEEYEKAKPIYFKKIDDTKVIYTQNEGDLADTSKWSELDFENGKYTISMTDKGVYGANITLVKTNADGTVKLNGAKFELYAVNGTKNELVYPLNNADYFEFNDGEVNLYNWFNSKDSSTYNPKYVQNGYLKPGGYYLYEIESPSLAYQRPEGPLYFTIEEYTDGDGNTCYRVNNEKTVAPSFVQISVGTVTGDNTNKIWNVIYNGETMNGDNSVAIEGIKSIKVRLKTNGKAKFHVDSGELNTSNGKATFDSETGFTTALFDPTTKLKKIEVQGDPWGDINVDYIEIETSSGTIYATSDPNPTPEDYKIESISVSPITAELIQIRARNGEIDPQWDGYCYQDDNWKQMNGGSNAPVIEGVTSIKVTAETEVILFSRNHLTGEAINGQTGTHNDNITTFTFNSPIDIDKIELQPKDNGWKPYRITNLEIETSSGKIYTTDQQFVDEMNVQAAKPDLSIKSITVYYLNGDSNTITYETALSASDNRNNDGSYSFEGFTLENNDEIVGMTLVVEGNGTGSVKIGNAWTISGATAGTYTVGRTDYQPPESKDEIDTSHLVNVTDTTITIKNELQGLDTNITAVKTWSGDADFKKYRPESIDVKLYRSVYPTGKDAEGKESLEYVGEISDPDYADFKENATVTLNESNGWKYSWKDLPSIYEQVINEETHEIDFEKSKRYYYFVKESVVPDMYDVTYPAQGSASGDYNITNTLKTVDIPVEKIWEKYGNNNVVLPDSIEVQLQIKDNGTWKNVDNKTITLSEANGWKGTFEDLPSGETYRAAEKTVPVGWHNNENDNSSSSNSEKTLTIKNILDVGNLNLVKNWTDDPDKDTRPDEIKFKLYRSIYKMSSAGGDVSVIEPSSQKYSTVTEDYARLLQYSLYFYDAQMCGDEVTQHSVLDWRDNCHDDGEYSGGFHDAGDHAMFGLAQGFTASTMGWTYNEYKNSFDTLGLTEHYQVIMKHFCDFFVKSTVLNGTSVEKLILDKGNADTDHKYWGKPEDQSIAQRGGIVWSSSEDRGGNIAAQYAATLASYVLNFPNDENNANYLKYAEALYAYSINTNDDTKNTHTISGIYDDESSIDEQAWAAAWLYLVTKDSKYEEDCETKLKSLEIPPRGHFWGDPALGAATIYTTRINRTDSEIKNLVTGFLDKCTGTDYKIFDDWGTCRHNTLAQLVGITYDKYNNSTEYSEWSKNQMKYILGQNSIQSNGNSSTCFVAGFAPNSSKYPHHRSASGYTAGENKNNAAYDTDGHVLIGALIGGPNANGEYLDNVDGTQLVWQTNEVALDYNAGLVGAAAALYSVYGSGFTVTEEIMVDDGLELESGMHTYEHKYESQTTPAVYGARNNPLSSMTFNFDTISVRAKEVQYPAYTSFGAITAGKTVTFNPPYQNVTRIEIDCTVEGNNAGFNLSIGFDKQNYSVSGLGSSGTIRTAPLDWTGNTVNSISIGDAWNLNTGTIDEIRFYYETEGTTITLTPSSKTAKIGETFKLTATGTTNTINWLSSDTSVATVDDDGNVTILKMPEEGNTVRITATDSQDSSATAYIDVNIEAMTLTANSSTPVIGDKITLNSNYTGFTINEGNGYTVDENTIIPTSKGNITVNATCGNASASTTLTVGALTISGDTTMTVGDRKTFGVNGQKDGHTFTWESSDKTNEKFTIDNNGNAQALASGTYTITVTKDGTYTATHSVEVTKGALTISVDKSQIRVGDTATLTAFNNEGQTVNYSPSSSNGAAATIVGNTITATEPGTLTITGVLGTESDTVELIIYAKPVITAPDGTYTLSTNQQLDLSASNIIGTPIWSSSNPDILEVDEATGRVTAKSSGRASITVKDQFDNAESEPYEIVVTLNVATVQLPANAEWVRDITLDETNEWTGDIRNLPKYDGNGNRYYYYVVELDSHGGEIDESTDRISGKGGALYVPTSYVNNGTLLGDNTEINVSNEIAEIVQGQMPSSGGVGRTTYYFFGGMIMLLSAAGYTCTRRRQSSRRAK